MSSSPVPPLSYKRASSSFWGAFSGALVGVALGVSVALLACPPVPAPASVDVPAPPVVAPAADAPSAPDSSAAPVKQ